MRERIANRNNERSVVLELPSSLRARVMAIWNDLKRQYCEVRASAENNAMPGKFGVVREYSMRAISISMLIMWPFILDAALNLMPNAEDISFIAAMATYLYVLCLTCAYFGSVWYFQAAAIVDNRRYRRAVTQIVVSTTVMSVLAPMLKVMPVWTPEGKISVASFMFAMSPLTLLMAVGTLVGARICFWVWKFYHWCKRWSNRRKLATVNANDSVYLLTVDDVSGWSTCEGLKKNDD